MKSKGVFGRARSAKCVRGGGNFSSLLPRARIPFPFPSERLLMLSRKKNPKLSPHIASQRGLEPGGRRVLPPLCHDGYFLFLNSPIESSVLVPFFVSHWVWRSHRLFSEEILIKGKIYLCSPLHAWNFSKPQGTNLFVCSQIFFLFRAHVRKWKTRRVY